MLTLGIHRLKLASDTKDEGGLRKPVHRTRLEEKAIGIGGLGHIKLDAFKLSKGVDEAAPRWRAALAHVGREQPPGYLRGILNGRLA